MDNKQNIYLKIRDYAETLKTQFTNSSDTSTLPLNELVKREPWRYGVGKPSNAMDLTWQARTEAPFCLKHDIVFEGGGKGSPWWFCASCGHTSRSTMHLHRKPQNPFDTLTEAVDFYTTKHGKTMESAEQMALVAAVAIRYASLTPDLSDYVERLVIK
jgi:hypothetical protein